MRWPIRMFLVMLICGVAAGCADVDTEDVVHTGGKLLYDTFKAAKDAARSGY